MQDPTRQILPRRSGARRTSLLGPVGLSLGLALTIPLAPSPARAQAAAVQAQPAAAADAAFQAASALFTQKKFAEAAPLLEKFVADFPKHPKAVQARLQWGASLLETGKPGPAAAAFQVVLTETQSPDLLFEAHYGSGRAYLALKDDVKAAASLQEAVRLSQQDRQNGPAVRLLLGDTLLRLGRAADALATYTDFHNRWPEHDQAPLAYYGIGESNRLLGNHVEAAITFRNFTDKHWRLPQASEASLKAGDAFLAAGRMDEAEEEYRRVLKDYLETPSAPRAQIGLGRLTFLQRDYPSARSAYQAAAVVFGNAGIGTEVELRIAETYLAERNWEEAGKRYAVLSAASDPAVSREARYGMARTQQGEGKLQAAVAEFSRLSEGPDTGRWGHLSRLRLAEIRTQSGDHAAALALIRPIFEARPEPDVRDEASLGLAEALLKSQDAAAAEAEVNALLKRAPQGPYAGRAKVLVAEARLATKPAEAIALLTELLATKLDPDTRAGALSGLGRAHLQAKQEKEGVTALNEVLEKHATAPAAAPAARALLAHYQAAGQVAKAAELEALINQLYGGATRVDDGLLSQAERLVQAGKHDEALKLYGQVLAQNPDRDRRLRVRGGMAESLAALKKPAEAAAQLAELAKDNAPAPVLAGIRYRVGRAHEKAGNGTAALAEYRAARQLGPEPEVAPGLLLNLARLLCENQKPAEAEPPLRELLTKHPKSPLLPEALYELAWVHLDLGQTEQARPVFIRLATDHPAHPLAADASFRIGEQEFRAGNYPAAIARYRVAAASKTPAAESAAYKLGWALRQTGDHAGAAQAFLRVLEAAPKGKLALESRTRAGEALLRLEKDKEALEQFQAVLSVQPVTAQDRELWIQAKVGAAQAYLTLGDSAKALELASETAMPANGWYGGRAQLARAEAVFQKDGPKAAVAEFSRGASLYARHRDVAAEAWFRVAECYEKLNDGKAAQAAWQRVVDQFAGTEWADRSRDRLNRAPAAANK